MRGRDQATGAALGLVFGFMLAWSGMASPAVIREALLFEDSYLFLFMASAVATATIGSHLARRLRSRAVLRDEPIAWSRPRPERRHITGALLFGVGWGVANVCPGPAAVQVGQGMGWGVADAHRDPARGVAAPARGRARVRARVGAPRHAGAGSCGAARGQRLNPRAGPRLRRAGTPPRARAVV